jgi:PST family polysaccharide transporter
MTRVPSAFHGMSWSAVSQAGRQTVQLAVTILVARLLGPGDFGVVAMALALTGSVAILGDFGISAVVIQKPTLSRDFLSTVFWLNVVFGLLAMLVIMGMAPLAAIFFREPGLTAILIVLSISFPITGLGILHKSLLERSMCFDVLARIELASTAIAGFVAVCGAYLGSGIWSLVLQLVITPVAMTVFLWLQATWRPSLVVRIAEFKSIARFSANVTGFNVANYLARNADYVLIGRFLGSQELGYYTLAYRILMFPLQNLSAVIVRVTFPVFSRLQEDDTRFRHTYLRSIAAIAVVTFPLMSFLFVVAEPFVGQLFGEHWLPTVPLLLILAPVGLIQSIGTTCGPIYMAKGRTGLLFKWGLLAAATVILSFIIGLRWGISGVAGCYAIASILLAYPGMTIPLSLIQLRVTDSLRVLWRPFICALIMACCVWVINLPLSSFLADWRLLAADAIAGLLTYFVASLMLNRAQVEVFWELLLRPMTDTSREMGTSAVPTAPLARSPERFR